MPKTTLIPSPKPTVNQSEVEIPFTATRKLGKEKYEVVSGVLRGIPRDVKLLESGVSLAVARDTARRNMQKQLGPMIANGGLSA